MNDSTTDDHNPSDLGDLEREIMDLVWRRGPVNADAVREMLSRPLKESTVRTVLKRLEEKGYLTHDVEGRTFIYRAAQGRDRVAARAVKRIVDWFCGGSAEDVVVGMVETDMLTPEQLQALAEKIEQARKRGK